MYKSDCLDEICFLPSYSCLARKINIAKFQKKLSHVLFVTDIAVRKLFVPDITVRTLFDILLVPL